MINDRWALWANAAGFNEMYDLRFFFFNFPVFVVF